MLKYLVLSVAMFSCVSFAETTEQNRTVMCDSAKIVIPYLQSEFNEYPMFIGDVQLEEDKTAYVGVTVNPESQTWTVILFNANSACLLESGTGFKFKMPDTIPSTKEYQ
tara:strand:+ start:5332 stop:5658 length:327 start_codon:yes stop_codon:yes gene_type:complete